MTPAQAALAEAAALETARVYSQTCPEHHHRADPQPPVDNHPSPVDTRPGLRLIHTTEVA